MDFKNNLAICYIELALVSLQQENLEQIKLHLKEAEKHFAELHAISPNNTQYKEYLGAVREALSNL